MSLKELILSTPDQEARQPIAVPQWPGTEGKLFIRNISALLDEQYTLMAIRYNKQLETGEGDFCFTAEIAALVLVDEAGNRIFTSKEDIRALSEKSPEAVNQVANAFYALRDKRDESKKK
jgi:hypothetical protein